MDDEQAMREVREGDVGRLEILFDRHSASLFRYFLHLTSDRAASEDLVQDVFFRILKYRRTYHPGTPFRAWMYQVGRNVYLDYNGRRRGEVALPEDAEPASGDLPPDRQAQNRQQAALLRRALAALPPDKREVLVLSRFLEWRYEQIASLLECEVGTVKVRVYRALRELGDRFFALTGERA